ncbi:UDP-glucose 4-epimerase GalE [Planococcus halocryophilus]|uniref:UDP-glucose 4-epimerase GalE n=1 Tax=Planococcus halocryophilus TaxID=1215089 RepID=UPI001F0CF536|nr:UDP-glucose 4-epimerase GalE [Planococcus halocryophilus]MCH4826781.1 UDP-glucose 4-epimerase GalE [Planococcus halocryophilus]
MSILITGGAGFIGSHAAVELLKDGYEIVVLDNLSNSKIESVNRVKELTGTEFPFFDIDLLDIQSLDEIFLKEKITAVMHFAGLKAVGESVELPLLYYNNNVTGTLNLIEVMKKYDVKNLVFSSSATVYGNPNQVPISESFPLSATNPYGKTKLMIEEILQDLYVSDDSWRISILRYFNPVGAHESGRIGENPLGTPNNLMPYITQVAIGNREELQVFGDDYNTEDGTGVRDYIHVVDLVKGHIKALSYLEENEGIETFNLGTGTGYSVLDLVNNFKEVSKKDIPYKVVDKRPGDIGICYADTEKAEKLLGWQAEKTLLQMCQDSWKWQVENPEGY